MRVILMLARDNGGLRIAEFGESHRERIARQFELLIGAGYARGVVIREGRRIELAELVNLTAEGDAFAAEVWPERTWHLALDRLGGIGDPSLALVRAAVAAATHAA